MDKAEEIRAALARGFDAQHLEVIDESEAHRGHAGYPEGGQSHFRVRMKAPELSHLSRLARHRAIHAAIGPDLIARIHALAIEVDG
ncbi:BolA family transcriptional regulator [Pelagivirga sediminicola]|uniref:BolA family transcriptional regulator n=1 Tax=Pelagivirga sediminicola TaxID=2170575 RepID=A0A2T7GA68_9RHOB|nr:BolA family protein [Pelagivirga sediminicola]PVA11315.1 BolA family transcriptional regulator [Pelagivirga sediminicola]